MTKVLLITGDAAEDLEVMYPYQRLLEEGYEVDIAAPAQNLQRRVLFAPPGAATPRCENRRPTDATYIF